MPSSFVSKLTILTASLAGLSAFACRVQPCIQSLAPATQQTLPANAQAIVAPGDRSLIVRVDADGGSRELDPLRTQPDRDVTLFAVGPLTPGDRITFNSTPDCRNPDGASSEILVGEPALLPGKLGEPSVSAAVTIEPPPSAGASCDIGDQHVKRQLLIDLDDSVKPWLSVAKVNVEVNGVRSPTAYGGLARTFDGGTHVAVKDLVRLCDSPVTRDWKIRMELEIPGVSERPPAVELEANMDCGPLQSCSSAGLIPTLFGAQLLARRRRARR
jgi:hypothetical protein